MSHLNSVRPSINFTVEVEKDGSLPFLDTLLQRRDDGSLYVAVYRKPTHTDRYLDFRSHHLPNVKRGLVRCVYDRARSITTRKDNLQKEECHLTKVLKQNSYPSAFIHSAFWLRCGDHRGTTTGRGTQTPTSNAPLHGRSQ